MRRSLRVGLATATVVMVTVALVSLAPFLGRPGAVRAQTTIGSLEGFFGGGGSFGGLCSGFGGFGGCSFGFNNFGGGFSGFGGSVLVTPDPTVAVGDQVPLLFAWIVPPPATWHEIQSLQVRLRDGADVALWLHWDQASDTLTLVDPETGHLRGATRQPGDGGHLTTRLARVDLRDSAVETSGEDGDAVALLLPVSFKTPAAGRTYQVEVGGTNDQGRVQGFAPVGTIEVRSRKD